MADVARNFMFFSLSTTVMVLLGLYICYRTVWGIASPLWVRVLLTVFILLISQAMTGMRYMVTLSPNLPFWFLRLGGYVSTLFMVLFSLVVIRDILLVGMLLYGKVTDSSHAWDIMRMLDMSRVDIALLLISLILAASGMWAALKVPHVKEVTIPVPDLPAALENLHIVQLSDLHIGSTFDGEWLQEVVAKTNALTPDIVFITGDLVDGIPSRLGPDLEPLNDLKALYGVYIIPGNHEYYSGLMPWVEHWKNMGLDILLNEYRQITVEKDKSCQQIAIAGVTDPSAQRFPGFPVPDPKGVMEQLPKDVFPILLAHQPRGARQNAAMGYKLQFSGHTHGGQYFFAFPLISLVNEGFRAGLYHVDTMKLYVSSGTGLWGYVPMRLGCPSEITSIYLKNDTQGTTPHTTSN